MKRKLQIVGIALLLIVSAFLWKNHQNGSEERIFKRVLTKMCMYPSKEAKELLEVVETEDRLKVMKKMYTADFSDEGFEDFCKNRYPLSIISAAEEAHCKIKVNKIELLKEASDTDNAYYYKASFLLDEKMPVSQNVIVCYENKKITKFQLVNNDLMDKIHEIHSLGG